MNGGPYSTAEGGVNYHAHPGFHTALLSPGTSIAMIRLSKRAMEKAPDGVVGGNVRPALFI